MPLHSSRALVLLTAIVLLMCPKAATHAANPLTQSLHDLPLEALFTVENGSVEVGNVDGEPVIRWHINNGQTSILAMRTEHPLFDRLRYYDRMQFDFRIASGEIANFGLRAVGHVSGPRQYKVHSFNLAKVTTERNVWHFRELDLAVPYWFPWDNADGEGETGYFKLEALGIADDTVVELRGARLLRGLLYRKPDFETPITWPVKTDNDDGSITYTLEWIVINTSGVPTDLTAKIVSEHEHFDVTLDKDTEAVKAAGRATFTAKATMSKSAIESTAELYAEPLRVSFSLSHRPEVTSVWEGPLVRPLSDSAKQQVVFSEKRSCAAAQDTRGRQRRRAARGDQL